MDAIESMDWGAYAHFRFQAQQLGFRAKEFPQVTQWMQDYYSVGGYVAILVLLLTTTLFLFMRGKLRGAVVVLFTFATAVGLIEAVHVLVPRRRPPDAQDWLGPHQMLGSYPSNSVFLFMLSVILLGYAVWSIIRRPWLRGLYVVIAALLTVGVCMSQLFLTLNFVSDVIGAIAGAALFGWIAYRILEKLADSPRLGSDWELYARFTDRARKVMQFANQEAQRLNHEYIGTEHILLGLVKEGSGVAANVLKNLDMDLRKIRSEVEKIVQAGPAMATMGKLLQTPRAKKVIEYAIEESRRMNHNYIGTEHLLLGLLRDEMTVAAQVLMNLGLKLEDVRKEVLNLLGPTTKKEDGHQPPGTANEGI